MSNCSCSTKDATWASTESTGSWGGRAPRPRRALRPGEAAGLAPHGSGRQTAVTRDKAGRAFHTNRRAARHGAGVRGSTLRLCGQGSDPPRPRHGRLPNCTTGRERRQPQRTILGMKQDSQPRGLPTRPGGACWCRCPHRGGLGPAADEPCDRTLSATVEQP